MSNNFSWQTEDDVVWDDEAMVQDMAVSRRPWTTFIVILAAVITVGVVIYRQVNERIETATANVKSDILASHNLVQQASLENDIDLFNTLLSGRNAAWASLQTLLAEEVQLYDRSAMGLNWQPPESPSMTTLADVESGTANIELAVDPELKAAELRFPQEYAIEVGNGVTETVILQQTAVYRRGSERWLYSPPDNTFWGEFVTSQGTMLTLAYPARDAVIAERLAFDLDAKLNAMCRALPALACPHDLRVHLRLSDDLNSLRASDPTAVLESGFRLELPTPTLVGLPVDEAGYQALYRGYAIRLVTAVIPPLVNYDCCQHAVFFQALLDYQLSRLGLRPWPVTADEYARIVSERVSVYELNQVWQQSSLDYLSSLNGWKAYTAVDYLIQRFPATAVADMQRFIPRRLNFTTWLLRLYGEGPTLSTSPVFLQTFDREWRAYALRQTLINQEPPPIPWPEQALYLACLDAEVRSFAASLQRLNLPDMTWTAVLSDTSAYFVNPLPRKDGLVIQFLGFDGGTSTTTIWRPGSDPLVMTNGLISLGQFAPDERLMAYGMSQEESAPTLIDVTDCPNGSCPLFPLAGLPVWSPGGGDFILLPEETLAQNPFRVNGRSYLFNQEQPPQEWPLHRGGTVPVTGNVDDMIAIGSGYAPFWLDETTYGYVRQVPISSSSTDHELVLASTLDDRSRSLVTEDELLAASPEGERPSNSDLNIHIVMRHPTRPDWLFILALGPTQTAYLFSYDVAEDVIAFHFRAGINYFHSLGVSPDGRFLTLAGTDLESGPSPANQILLYDTQREQVDLFGVSGESSFAPANIYDWSADGQWLAMILDEFSLLLVAPEQNYQQVIPHDLGQCTNVIWLNK